MNKYNMDGFEACTHVAMQYMVSAAGLKAILEAYEAAKGPERESFAPTICECKGYNGVHYSNCPYYKEIEGGSK